MCFWLLKASNDSLDGEDENLQFLDLLPQVKMDIVTTLGQSHNFRFLQRTEVTISDFNRTKQLQYNIQFFVTS